MSASNLEGAHGNMSPSAIFNAFATAHAVIFLNVKRMSALPINAVTNVYLKKKFKKKKFNRMLGSVGTKSFIPFHHIVNVNDVG